MFFSVWFLISVYSMTETTFWGFDPKFLWSCRLHMKMKPSSHHIENQSSVNPQCAASVLPFLWECVRRPEVKQFAANAAALLNRSPTKFQEICVTIFFSVCLVACQTNHELSLCANLQQNILKKNQWIRHISFYLPSVVVFYQEDATSTPISHFLAQSMLG